MANEQLRKSIRDIRGEINRIEFKNTAKKDQMQELLDELENHMDHPEDVENSQKLIDKLEGVIEEYEVKHPHLASALEEILVTLSNMGI